MRLDVVGMAVAAELVVRDEHLRTHLADDLDQEVRRLGEIGVPERVVAGLVHRSGVAVRTPLHAGVAVVERAAEEAVVGDAEDLHRGLELADAIRAEPVVLVGGEVLDLGHQDLALLAGRARDERDLHALGDVARHGGAVADALVVRMRVHEQDPAVVQGHVARLRPAERLRPR